MNITGKFYIIMGLIIYCFLPCGSIEAKSSAHPPTVLQQSIKMGPLFDRQTFRFSKNRLVIAHDRLQGIHPPARKNNVAGFYEPQSKSCALSLRSADAASGDTLSSEEQDLGKVRPKQILGGVLSGVTFTLAGTGLALYFGIDGEWREINALFVGGVPGLMIGSALGVYIVGRRAGGEGSLAATLLGSIVGGVLGSFFFLQNGEDGLPIFILSPAVCAMLGYQWTDSSGEGRKALLNFQSQRLTFGWPRPKLFGINERGTGTRLWQVNFISLRF